MFFASISRGSTTGEVLAPYFTFFLLAALVAGVIFLLVKLKKKSEQLTRVEEKLDELLSDKKK